jgi:hypothetical protein
MTRAMMVLTGVATLGEQGHAIRLIIRTDQRDLSSAVVWVFAKRRAVRLSAWMPI